MSKAFVYVGYYAWLIVYVKHDVCFFWASLIRVVFLHWMLGVDIEDDLGYVRQVCCYVMLIHSKMPKGGSGCIFWVQLGSGVAKTICTLICLLPSHFIQQCCVIRCIFHHTMASLRVSLNLHVGLHRWTLMGSMNGKDLHCEFVTPWVCPIAAVSKVLYITSHADGRHHAIPSNEAALLQLWHRRLSWHCRKTMPCGIAPFALK